MLGSVLGFSSKIKLNSNKKPTLKVGFLFEFKLFQISIYNWQLGLN